MSIRHQNLEAQSLRSTWLRRATSQRLWITWFAMELPNFSKGKAISPLEVAVRGSHTTVARILLHHGARMHTDTDVNADIWRGVLLDVAKANDGVMLPLFLEHGAAIKSPSQVSSYSALHYAVANGKYSLMKELLCNKADIEVKDKSGRTPLHFAALKGDESILKLLLGKGSDIEAKDLERRTSLHFAASRADESTLKMLLESNAYIEARTGDELTPLHIAASAGQNAVVQLSITEEAHDSLLTKSLTNLGFMMAFTETSDLSPTWIREKSLSITDADLLQDSGNSSTHLCLGAPRYIISAAELLQRGANVAAKAENWATPLHWAALRGDLAMVQLFLDHVAQAETKD